MNRQLDPSELQYAGSLVDIGTTWSDYDGDETYGNNGDILVFELVFRTSGVALSWK